MNIRNYGLNSVPAGSRQSLHIGEHNKTLEVISDGKIDAPMMDGFHSPGAVQSIRDPRLEALRGDVHAWLHASRTPEYEYDEDKAARLKVLADLKEAGKGDLKGIVLANLGPSWDLCRSDLRTGGCGAIDINLKEGDRTLGITVARFSGDYNDLTLWSHRQEGPFTRSHAIHRDARSGEARESVRLTDTRVPAPNVIFTGWMS